MEYDLIYKTKAFSILAKRLKVVDIDLIEVCSELHKGLIDAKLGGYLIKQRMAVGSQGKSAGIRLILAALLM